MAVFARNERLSMSRIGIVVAVCAIVCLASPLSAPADCTNYEDYLHWIAEQELSIRASDLYVQGDYMYIVGNQTAEPTGRGYLQIADITNVGAPEILSTMELPTGAAYVWVSDGLAAITENEPALTLVDVSDPASPDTLSHLLPGKKGKRVIMDGEYLYMVCNRTTDCDLISVDISDPESPQILSEVPFTQHAYGGLAVEGDYLYVGTMHQGLATVDISSPGSLQVVDSDTLGSGYAVFDMAREDDRLYIVAPGGSGAPLKLVVYDLSAPSDPEELGRALLTQPVGCTYDRIAVAENTCYLCYSVVEEYDCADLIMLDVSEPDSIAEIGSLPCNGQYLQRLVVFGTKLYYVSNTHPPGPYVGYINSYSISSPDPLEPIGTVDTPGEARAISVPPERAGLAYVADGTAGLQIIDTTDPLNPVRVDSVDTPGYAWDVAVHDSLAYVADGSSGLQVVNVAMQEPAIIGAADTPGEAVALSVVDTLVYVADSSGGLRILSVRSPDAPVPLGAENVVLQNAQGIDVQGAVAYVADGAGGMHSVDVSDPDDPRIIDGVKGRDVVNAKKVDARGDRVYVTDEAVGLVVVDCSDPGNLQTLSSVTTDSTASDVDLLGIFAFVGDGASMRLVDLWDELSPQIVGGVDVSEAAHGLFVNEDYAYVAAGSAGVHICPTQCGFDEAVVAAFVPVPGADFYPATIRFTNLSIGYGMTYSWDFGDSVGTSTEESPLYTYGEPGDYTVTLTATNGTNTDETSAMVSALAEPPTILDVTDVPNDQGGYVYIEFYHSGYDDDPLSRSEMYTIQRQDDGVWVSLTSFGAYGEHYYTALAWTQGDGPSYEAPFRVIAHMDEGNWASDPMSGYSVNNMETGVPDIITEVELSQAVPNPFNPATEIAYAVPSRCRVRLSIYDVSGRLVRTLVDRDVEPGRHSAIWLGRDEGGNEVGSGVYFYKLAAGDTSLRRSMTLLK